jgi:hypothetical protein
MGVGTQITLLVDGVVGDPGISLDSTDQWRQELWRNEKLEVCLIVSLITIPSRLSTDLLIHVSALWTPSVNTVITPGSIDSRLRVDSQVTQFVHLGQLIRDNGSLGCSGLRRPRELLEVSSTETGKEMTDVGECGRVAP